MVVYSTAAAAADSSDNRPCTTILGCILSYLSSTIIVMWEHRSPSGCRNEMGPRALLTIRTTSEMFPRSKLRLFPGPPCSTTFVAMSAQQRSRQPSRLEGFTSTVLGKNSTFIVKQSTHTSASNIHPAKYLDFPEHHSVAQFFCHVASDEKLVIIQEYKKTRTTEMAPV